MWYGKLAMKWRKLLFSLHRDVGFLCLGLTIVYAVSGVAVNHRHHWDYNYSVSSEQRRLGPPEILLGVAKQPSKPWTAADRGALARQRQTELVAELCKTLGRGDAPRTVFWRNPDRLSLFFGPADSDVIDYTPSTGDALSVRRDERFLLRQLNLLHLNEPRGIWTYIADLFAVALLFLGISGVILVRGKRGLRGRGGMLMVAGFVLPIIAVLLL